MVDVCSGINVTGEHLSFGVAVVASVVGLLHVSWGVCVDRQLKFAQALLHKAVVLEVAFAAKARGCTELVGVLYNELARWL